MVSCNQPIKSDISSHEFSESEKLEIKLRAKAMTDSTIRGITKKVLFDTVGVSNGPIKVLSAKIIKEDYSSFKDISLTFKNISNKRIEGIRFRWYGENAFGEPAEMGNASLLTNFEGFGSGEDDDPLGPGKTRTSQWNINSRNAKKVIIAWPYEVVFSDGTKWKTSNN